MSTLTKAVAGIDGLLAGGGIDIIFCPAKPSGVLAVAHRLHDDGTDEEVAVVQSPGYAEAQIAIHEALVHAGCGVVAVS